MGLACWPASQASWEPTRTRSVSALETRDSIDQCAPRIHASTRYTLWYRQCCGGSQEVRSVSHECSHRELEIR